MNFANNLSFSLYTILFICYRVATLEREMESKKMSSDKKVYYCKILEFINK